MTSHPDEAPWSRHERGELRVARHGPGLPRGGAGATLSRCEGEGEE